MKSTGKFDHNGQEIFVGDKVMKWWGSFEWNGKRRNMLQYHTITERPAHMMANGQMHDDGDGVIFTLGRSYNFWEGKQVHKMAEDHTLIKEGFPEDTNFFLEDDGTVVRFTDQHFMGLSDEEWEAEVERRRELFYGIKEKYGNGDREEVPGE